MAIVSVFPAKASPGRMAGRQRSLRADRGQVPSSFSATTTTCTARCRSVSRRRRSRRNRNSHAGRVGEDQSPLRDSIGEGISVAWQGIRGVRSREHGDLLCHVVVETPVNLTDRQRELLRELRGDQPGRTATGTTPVPSLGWRKSKNSRSIARPRASVPFCGVESPLRRASSQGAT